MDADFILGQYEAVFAFACVRVLQGHDWPDLAEAVAVNKRRCDHSQLMQKHTIMPTLTCVATGGDAEQVVPLTAAWLLYDLASDVLDDVQDHEHKDLSWNHWPPDRAMLVGTGLLFAAQLCLAGLDAPADVLAEIQEALARTGLMAAQAQTIATNDLSLSSYLHRIIANTGIVYATAAWMGARVHSRDPRILKPLREYGLALGTLIQIRDDCVDLSVSRVASDLARGNYTLPVLYALAQTGDPNHGQLQALIRSGNPVPLEQVEDVVQILQEMKALSYTTAVAKVYEQKAMAALDELPEHDTACLRVYATDIFATFFETR